MLLADSSLAQFLRMLSDLPDPDTVAGAIARGPLSPFQPAVVAIGFIRLQREALSVVGVFGRERELRQQYQEVPLTADLPATVCFRTNDVVTTPSARMAEEFPLVTPYVNAAAVHPDGVATTFPVRHRGAVVGVLGVEVAQPPVEPWYLRSAVSILSGPLALWTVLRMQVDDGDEAYWSRRPTRALTVSDRQQQILRLVRQGLTNPQIAAEIGYSIPTVKSELARLSQLFGATSRDDLAQKAARAGL
jgi:DNA-binding CsgD family transcriptional regulator